MYSSAEFVLIQMIKNNLNLFQFYVYNEAETL